MPTLIEISDDLARSYLHASNKRHAAKRIITEVSSLVYSSSKQPVEHSVKILILHLVYEFITGKRTALHKNGTAISLKREHISLFVKLSNKFLNKDPEAPM
jgi:hypothetical protein